MNTNTKTNAKTNIKIKDYSRSKYFDSILELKTILKHDYLGRHIAIHYRTKTNFIQVIFVSVSESGVITDSYKGEEINFDQIESDLLKD